MSKESCPNTQLYGYFSSISMMLYFDKVIDVAQLSMIGALIFIEYIVHTILPVVLVIVVL